MNLLKLSYPNIKYLQKPTAIIILNNETLKSTLISRIRQGYPLSTLLLNIVLSISGVIHQKKWWIKFYETKNLSSVKGTVKRVKRQCTGWEKILPNHISNKGLVSGIYKDFLKLKSKKTNNSIKKFFLNGQTVAQCEVSEVRAEQVKRTSMMGEGVSPGDGNQVQEGWTWCPREGAAWCAMWEPK